MTARTIIWTAKTRTRDVGGTPTPVLVDANETSFLMDNIQIVGAEKLLRQAHIATTMNVYGNAMMESKRGG